jgi:16S rRNA processing protein RimM
MTSEPEDTSDVPIVLGVIAGSHGVSGRVRVKPFTDDPVAIGDYGPVLVGGGSHEIKVTGTSKGQVIVALEGIKDRDAADALRGAELSVTRVALGHPEEDGEGWYYTDLVGLKVETADGELLGTVEAVHDFGAGDLIEIVPVAGGETVMMAFNESNVPVVDLGGGRLVADPPLGTFEVEEDKPKPRKRRRSPKARARAQAKAAAEAADQAETGDGND